MKFLRPLAAVLVLAASFVVFEPSPDDAAAFDPGSLPVPYTWAGAGTVGAAIGQLVMLPTVGTIGAGAAVTAFPASVGAAAVASFGAGFAVGYYGVAPALCGLIDTGPVPTSVDDADFVQQACGTSYEFEPFDPQYDVGASAPVPSNITGRWVSTIEYDELVDYGQGQGIPVVEWFDGKGQRVQTPTRPAGCLFMPSAGNGIAFGTGTAACPGQSGSEANGSLLNAPYRDGVIRLMSASTGPSRDCFVSVSGGSVTYAEGRRNCGFEPRDQFRIRLMRNGMIQGQDAELSLGYVQARPDVNARGFEVQNRIEAQCWIGPNWTLVAANATSPWYFENQSGDRPAMENPCPAGSIMRAFTIFTRWYNRIGSLVSSPVYTWEAPPEWNPQTNPDWQHQDCTKKGSGCEVKIANPEAPENQQQCQWGTQPVSSAFCEQPKPELIPWPPADPDSDPDPNPTTTTVVAPTTVAPSTTTTTTPGGGDPECPNAPGCPQPPPPDPGGGSECWPSGWGWFNPLEWVYRPIVCVAEWLFIPPEPEWSDQLAEFGALMEEPPGQWVTGAVDVLGDSSLTFSNLADYPGCATFFGSEVCVGDFDVWYLSGWLRTGFFVGLWLALGIAVVRWL